MTKVLVLGAGLVAKPLVDYLAERDDLEITVADIVQSKAEALTEPYGNASALGFDVNEEGTLEDLVRSHDLSVSLLPGPEHPRVARLCLRHGKHMAHASYISPEMKEMAEDVAAAGLTFVNECGVDPGLDHMSAKRLIDDAHRNGGKVISFRSYCGGLPAPEANTNPLGYKFSWAPHGVLGAAISPARYLKSGEMVDVPGNELFKSPEIVEFPGVGRFEGYANRDSMGYVDLYDIPEVETLFRGTLRNEGHCAVWYPWVQLGLFDTEDRNDWDGLCYKRFMQSLIGEPGDPKTKLAKLWEVPDDSPVIAQLEWLGMFAEEPVGLDKGKTVDVVAKRMVERCSYDAGERDMIVMQHEFVFRYESGDKRVYSTLVDFGIPGGDSSMARTVSLPLAIATTMVLDGKIQERGVVTPVMPGIYNPILDELEGVGIKFEEWEA